MKALNFYVGFHLHIPVRGRYMLCKICKAKLEGKKKSLRVWSKIFA